MFEMVDVVAAQGAVPPEAVAREVACLAQVVADPGVPLFERFQVSVRLGRLVEAVQAQVLCDLARQHGWDETDQYDMDEARWVRCGADPDAQVDEDLPLEVAVAMGVGVNTATCLLQDVINLQARHPRTWTMMTQGQVALYRARKVAEACSQVDLDKTETGLVDAQISPVLASLSWGRVLNKLRATVMRVAPGKVEAYQKRIRSGRFVYRKACPENPSTSLVSAQMDTADALFLDATIGLLADRLEDPDCDVDDVGRRRAKALGILASPAQALLLLGVHTRRGLPDDVDTGQLMKQAAALVSSGRGHPVAPKAQVYVHMYNETLTYGDAVVRVEDAGPLMVKDLKDVLGGCHIRITPVIHINDADEPSTDAYEIPDAVREHVILRDGFEVFPWSNRSARHLDMDHTDPYQQGLPGQTRPSNLGPLTRRAHRAKTHCGWQLDQPEPGLFLWRTRRGQLIAVDNQGTHPYPQRC